jgi:ABC-2 type transport system permease protein
MGKLFFSSLKMLYRDKQALFWALAFPVIFAVVFGLFNFNEAPQVKIDAVGQAGTPAYDAVVGGLMKVDSFEVKQRSNLAASRTRLMDGDVDVVVSVPETSVPDARLQLQVLYNGTNFQANQFAITTIGRIVDQMNLGLAGVTTPAVTVQNRAVAAKSVTYYDFLLPGLVAMGVMNFSIGGMSVAIARFREQRILKRILATPLAPVKFLAAQVGARLVLALLQAALILIVGVYVFDGHVYGNVLWIFVLATIANLIFLNIAFAIAGRASNPDAAQGLAQAVALPMMFLSGTFFPTETLPSVMQVIVKVLPLTPLLEAMRTVSVDAKSITATGPQLLQLGIWVVVSFEIASRLFRFSEAR